MADRIDKKWFTDQLAKAGKSQNGLARHLGLQGSAMVRLFAGTRRMQLEEAEKIARFLNVATDEVLTHAGITLTPQMRDLELRNVIDAEGAFKPSPEPMVISGEIMDRLKANIPLDRRDRYQVALVRSPKGSLWTLHENLVLFEELTRINPAPRSTFSISLLRNGETVLAKVEDVSKTGEATIRMPNGDARKVEIVASSPVLLAMA